jgi:hypothetical protein
MLSIIYWSLLLFAPNLIMPLDESEGEPSVDAPPPFRLDLKVDLALHALPAVALFLDYMFFERKFSRREMRLRAPLMALLMSVWYGAWVEYCATYNDGICKYLFSPLCTLQDAE